MSDQPKPSDSPASPTPSSPPAADPGAGATGALAAPGDAPTLAVPAPALAPTGAVPAPSSAAAAPTVAMPAPSPASAAATPEASRSAPAAAPPRPGADALPPGAVRARDIRAAARSPAEIAQAVVRENQVRAKRALKQRAMARALDRMQEKTAGSDAGAGASSAGPVPAPAAPGAPVAAPPPAPLPPLPPAPGGTSKPATARVPAPVASPIRTPSERFVAAPRPLPPPSSAPSASSTASRTASSSASGLADVPEGSRPGARRRIQDVSAWLIFWALVIQVVTLVFVARTVTRAGTAVDRAAAAIADAHAAPPTQAASASAPAASGAPTVASLGEGRIVVARPDGKLVVLHRDATSGELVIERTYALEEDDARNLGDDAHRAYSGLYLTDVERSRRAAVETEDRLYRETLARALEHSDGLERAEEAARRLARVGGFDRLIAHLEDQDHVARRTAAIALAELGYLRSIPRVCEVLEATGDSDLARHLTLLLRDMTGLALDPGDPRAVISQRARDWWDKNRPEDPYARRGH